MKLFRKIDFFLNDGFPKYYLKWVIVLDFVDSYRIYSIALVLVTMVLKMITDDVLQSWFDHSIFRTMALH